MAENRSHCNMFQEKNSKIFFFKEFFQLRRQRTRRKSGSVWPRRHAPVTQPIVGGIQRRGAWREAADVAADITGKTGNYGPAEYHSARQRARKKAAPVGLDAPTPAFVSIQDLISVFPL